VLGASAPAVGVIAVCVIGNASRGGMRLKGEVGSTLDFNLEIRHFDFLARESAARGAKAYRVRGCGSRVRDCDRHPDEKDKRSQYQAGSPSHSIRRL